MYLWYFSVMFVLLNTWFVFWQARSQWATGCLSHSRAEQKTPASAGTSPDNRDAQMWTEQHSTCSDRDSATGTGCSRSRTGIWYCLFLLDVYSALFLLTAVFFSSRFAMPCMLRPDISHCSAFLFAVEKERFFLWQLCDGNLEGGLIYWVPWPMCKERLWKRAALSLGTTLGGREGVYITGNFERTLCKQRLSCMGPLWGNPAGGAPLLGILKDM